MDDKIVELANQLRKTFGIGAMVLGEDPSIINSYKERVPTGIFEMDRATGGGYVKGCMHEIFGNEGEGKTTLALHGVAAAQRMGMNVLWLDAEHSLNLDYAAKLGVDINNLLVVQPDYGEQGLDALQYAIDTHNIHYVVIDSVSALVPKSEIDGDFTDANMGAHARLMSKMCRVLTPAISRNDIVLILINQVRLKIGVFFGSPEVTTGGKGIKFYSQIRMRVSSSKIDGETDQIRDLKVVFVKHKWGKMYDEAKMRIMLGCGVDLAFDKLSQYLASGKFELRGSNYYCEGKLIASGKAKAIAWIRSEGKETINNEQTSDGSPN